MDNGKVIQYDPVKNKEVNSVVLMNGIQGLDGICYDEKKKVIYATSTGVGIWAIETINLNVTEVYSQDIGITDEYGDMLWDETINEIYIYRPNGCTVKNDKVYFVEMRNDSLDNEGYLGIYDIENEEFSVNTEVLERGGHGMYTTVYISN